MSTQCKSCGAPIVWTVTEGGRRMPVDQEPVEEGNIRLFDPQEKGGPPLAVYDSKEGRDLFADPDEPRFLSHFASCPQADDWRKK